MSVLERTVRETMETDVVEVRPDLPVKELIEVLEEHEITGAPVFEDDRLAGVLSLRDVVGAVAEAAEE